MSEWLLLMAGLALLVVGGEGLVRGASAIADRAGVSPLVIGLTVVAFGTSAPELSVSVRSALDGKSGITFGNVVGSNVANLGLLLGITAWIRPLAVDVQVVRREIPMLVLTALAACALGFDYWLHGGVDGYHRADGVMLLLLFGVFLYYTTVDALRAPRVAGAAPAPVTMGLWPAVGCVLLGLGGLAYGGGLVVDSAVVIARQWSMSEAAIGATIVAVGTSLPELVTCVVAARRGMSDLAVGNVVGSNIFNSLFVLGTTATIHPVAIPVGGWIDLVVMTALSVLLLPVAMTDRRITRVEASVFLAAFVGYATWQVGR